MSFYPFLLEGATLGMSAVKVVTKLNGVAAVAQLFHLAFEYVVVDMLGFADVLIG